jgi:hypothetical protein
MQRRFAKATFIVAALLGVAVVTAPAAAYVQARDRVTGRPLRWGSGEVLFTLSASGSSRDLDAAAVTYALEQAAARWTRDVGCGGLAARVAPPSTAADHVRRDGVNAGVFHARRWARNGDEGDARRGYDADVQAMTTTYLDRDETQGTAWIAEADIKLNAVSFRWLAAGSPASTPPWLKFQRHWSDGNGEDGSSSLAPRPGRLNALSSCSTHRPRARCHSSPSSSTLEFGGSASSSCGRAGPKSRGSSTRAARCSKGSSTRRLPSKPLWLASATG